MSDKLQFVVSVKAQLRSYRSDKPKFVGHFGSRLSQILLKQFVINGKGGLGSFHICCFVGPSTNAARLSEFASEPFGQVGTLVISCTEKQTIAA